MSYIMDLRKVVGHRPLLQVGASVIVVDEYLALVLKSSVKYNWCKNFIRLKQREAGDLNQRFEPPVNSFYAIFQSLFKHFSQLVFEWDFKHEIRPEK